MLTAITGGIGSGKTVVSQIISMIGYPVYDCDRRATEIMDADLEIKRQIAQLIHGDCVLDDGRIDRKRLSEIVFSDYDSLQRLNGIVHGAVRRDLALWYECQRNRRAFVETAILYQSGIDRMVDDVWEIEAPLDVRVQRVMRRNGFSREQVLARISSQDSFIVNESHPNVRSIINDSVVPLLPQIEDALGTLNCCDL